VIPQHSESTGHGAGWLDAAGVCGLEALARHTDAIMAELHGLLEERVWAPWGNAHYTPTFTRMSAAQIAAELSRGRDRIGAGRLPAWRLYGLFLKGEAVADAMTHCPQTARAVAAVPGMVNAGFSCLEAGYRLTTHVGHDPQLRRAHLGLVVPEGDCALRVDGETRHWRHGQVLAFDDTHPHEAWNLTEAHRIVLIVDIHSNRARPS
jgi:hypothetical protein